MPVRIKKINGYRVTHGEKVSAKRTTKEKAEAQARLLRALEHSNWRPTGKKARKTTKKRKKK